MSPGNESRSLGGGQGESGEAERVKAEEQQQDFNPKHQPQQRLPLSKIRERIARALFPEGFYFDHDTSREIDRLIVLVESLGGRA